MRPAKNLKGEIDEDLIEPYRGTFSLPFKPGDPKRVAVKSIDDRGIESLKIVEVAHDRLAHKTEELAELPGC